MSDRSGENKKAQNAEADQEQVKIAVVALSHAIAHPRTVMVESGNAVIAKRAVGSARRSEESTGVTVFQLDGHPVYRNDLVARFVQTTGFFFLVFDDLLHSVSFSIGRPGDDSGVATGCAQQKANRKDCKNCSSQDDEPAEVDFGVCEATFKGEEER